MGNIMQLEKYAIIDNALSTDEGIVAIAEAASNVLLDAKQKENRKKSIIALLQSQRHLSKIDGSLHPDTEDVS